MSFMRTFVDAVKSGQTQAPRGAAAVTGGQQKVDGDEPLRSEQPKQYFVTPVPLMNEFQLRDEKKRIESKLNSSSYVGEDADRARLTEINEKLEANAALMQATQPAPVAKPAPLPADEQAILSTYGPDGLKMYQEQKAGIADRQKEVVEAHKSYKATGQIPQTKNAYAWIEIMEGRLMDRAKRMDAMLTKQGKTVPQMGDVNDTDPVYLTKDEFIAETKKRAEDFLDDCGRHSSKCQEEVNEKFGGKGFKEYDKAESQRKMQQYEAVKEKIDGVVNSGPVSLAARAGCAVAGAGEKVQEVCAAVGGVGDAVAVGAAGRKEMNRTANYNESGGHEVGRDATVITPPKAPNAGVGPKSDGVPEELVKVNTANGAVELTKTKVSVEQVNAQKWLQEQKEADAKLPEAKRRSDAQLIKDARAKFHIDVHWEPFAQHEREVTIQTTKGPQTMTVEEYRKRVDKADAWVNKEREKARIKGGNQPSESDLARAAAAEVGLDDSWQAIDNPNYHGARVPAAKPKGESVSPQAVRQMQHNGTEVVEVASSEAHAKAWRALGHQEDVPIAFSVNNKIYLDKSRWPKDLPREWDPHPR
jgi:hypothetical protein